MVGKNRGQPKRERKHRNDDHHGHFADVEKRQHRAEQTVRKL